MKNIAILGSTGSIGINTLDVIRSFPEKFKVVALSAYDNVDLLTKQAKEFFPKYVAVGKNGIRQVQKNIGYKSVKVFDVASDICDIIKQKDIDIVVVGIRGSAALLPFLSAVRAGKTVAPANKEALVMAGHILMAEAKKYHATIIPVDSEQSAIFQCLQGKDKRELKKVYLTASGGPLKDVPKNHFDKISLKEILRHPRWKMGKKITIDSATLMNKGLEMIEAKWLFGLDLGSQIEVIIHPQAIIHSMAEFRDGSILAQLAITDMRLPIQYALTYPQRFENRLEKMDFYRLKELTFEKPDFRKFPALLLCLEVGKRGGTLPSVLNAANEEAVEAYLKGKIYFSNIYRVVEKVVRKHKIMTKPSLQDIWLSDSWAREEAKKVIEN